MRQPRSTLSGRFSLLGCLPHLSPACVSFAPWLYQQQPSADPHHSGETWPLRAGSQLINSEPRAVLLSPFSASSTGSLSLTWATSSPHSYFPTSRNQFNRCGRSHQLQPTHSGGDNMQEPPAPPSYFPFLGFGIWSTKWRGGLPVSGQGKEVSWRGRRQFSWPRLRPRQTPPSSHAQAAGLEQNWFHNLTSASAFCIMICHLVPTSQS